MIRRVEWGPSFGRRMGRVEGASFGPRMGLVKGCIIWSSVGMSGGGHHSVLGWGK